MPSIRVKRSYTTIQENTSPDDSLPPPRPPVTRRSRSWTLFSPPVLNESDESSKLQPRSRQRSQTYSGAPPLQDQDAGNNSRTYPRTPSRVRKHILSTTRLPLSPAQDHRDPVSYFSQVRRSLSRHSECSEMISLEGPNEDVLIPEDPGHEPGRVNRALSIRSRDEEDPFEEHHHDDIVEHLDVIDPQVATVSTLTNAANAIVFPPLSFYSRKPVIVLPEIRRQPTAAGEDAEKGRSDEDNLDRHIEDVLTRRQRFKRIMRGVWSFMKTPMGIIVSIYGFLVVFWGSGIVLFLAKMINLHNENTQGFWVELCQQVETGLFSATSIGFIPFRTLDTWRVYWIWHYKKKTRILREKAGLPELYDPDDLPDPAYDKNYVHVLTDEEQADLHYQQYKFAQSQTWYRPHGTQTHRAFPINTALLILILNDLNSVFQILLSGCMWGLNRFQRPAWTTATTLPAAFVCGIAAGVYIWWGGRKTRRHEQVEQRLRTALAMDNPRPDLPPPTITFTSADGDGDLQPAEGAAQEGSSSSTQGQSPPSASPDSTLSPEDSAGHDTVTASTSSIQLRDRKGRKDSVQSTTVRIADEMTIPPAEELHGSEDAVQGHPKR